MLSAGRREGAAMVPPHRRCAPSSQPKLQPLPLPARILRPNFECGSPRAGTPWGWGEGPEWVQEGH